MANGSLFGNAITTYFSFNSRLLFYLIAGFVLATIIGTITHELGHYVVAKSLGYNAEINYGSTSWTKKPNQIKKDTDNFCISAGGPIETMATGSIGLLLLFIFRKKFYSADRLNLLQWVIVFTSLFWLRQTANFLTWIGGYMITGRFSLRSDEIILARLLNFPIWSISIVTAFAGILVLTLVVFKFIPALQRFTFLLAGIIGGIAGYIIWLHLLGPMIMP